MLLAREEKIILSAQFQQMIKCVHCSSGDCSRFFCDPEILGDRTCGESQFFDVTHLSESQSRRDFA